MKTAQNLINKNLPSLGNGGDALVALNLMDEYRLGHLPVVENGKFQGLVSEADLLESEHYEGRVETAVRLIEVSVLPGQHILDVLKVASEYRLSLVAVADEDKNYLGSISLEDLVEYLSDYQSASQPGGIIVLEMNPGDYHLSKIAHIVEENNAKILHTNVMPSEENDMMEVHLKINKSDLNAILQSLNRFGFQVKASYQEPVYTEDLRKRYEELMKYLNM
ncbi:MAG: CBS domain-containing protein [Flavobacteriales bacterium]|nr:CBS domain-containing protein [Flavobacteriales bacterium]